MDDQTQQVLFGQIRTALAAIGGALVTQGIVSSGTVNIVLGIIMAIIPLVWSAWAHIQAERKTKVREVIALNAGVVVADSTVGATPPVSAVDSKKTIAEFVAPGPSMAERLNVVPPSVQSTITTKVLAPPLEDVRLAAGQGASDALKEPFASKNLSPTNFSVAESPVA